MHRIETNQSHHGVPMPDATQWDLIRSAYPTVKAVYGELQKQASNGSLMLYDDTPGRILEYKTQGLATHTTAFISVYEEHKIHLFFTGRNHAGKNSGAILDKRTNKESLIAMMDASPSNAPQMQTELTARFILCFCLVHGRRNFFEISNSFEENCDFVLNIIGQVYANDAHCKQNKLTPEARLLYHQTYYNIFTCGRCSTR